MMYKLELSVMTVHHVKLQLIFSTVGCWKGKVSYKYIYILLNIYCIFIYLIIKSKMFTYV